MYGYTCSGTYDGSKLSDHPNWLVHLGIAHYVLPAISKLIVSRHSKGIKTTAVVYLEDDVVPMQPFRTFLQDVNECATPLFWAGWVKKYTFGSQAVVFKQDGLQKLLALMRLKQTWWRHWDCLLLRRLSSDITWANKRNFQQLGHYSPIIGDWRPGLTPESAKQAVTQLA